MRTGLAIALTSLCLLLVVPGCQSERSKDIQRQPRSQEDRKPTTHFAAQTKFDLGYDFLSSRFHGVPAVDVWIQSRGQWTRHERLTLPRESASVTVKNDGLYGFTLTNPDQATGNPVNPGNKMPEQFVLVDTTIPVVVVTAPNGGNYLPAGNTTTITWTAFDRNLADHAITIDWSSDNGSNWLPIASGLKNTGSYTWELPDVSTDAGVLRVSVMDLAGHIGLDQSDTAFHIEQAGLGLTLQISDESRGTSGSMKFDYTLLDPSGRCHKVAFLVTSKDDPSFRRVFYDEDARSPATLDLPDGEYRVTANALDTKGFEILPSPATGTLLIGNEAVGVVLHSPLPDKTYPVASVVDVRWTVTDSEFGPYKATLELQKGESPWFTVRSDQRAKGRIRWRTPIEPGEYTLRLTLQNQQGGKLQNTTPRGFFVGTPQVNIKATRAFVNADGNLVVKFEAKGSGLRLANEVKVWLWSAKSKSWSAVKSFAVIPDRIEFPVGDGDFGLALTASIIGGYQEPKPRTESDREVKFNINLAAARYAVSELDKVYPPTASVLIQATGPTGAAANIQKVDLMQNGVSLHSLPADPKTPGQITVPLRRLKDGPFELHTTVMDDDGNTVTAIRESKMDSRGPDLFTGTTFILSSAEDIAIHYNLSDPGSGIRSAKLQLYDKDMTPLRSLPLDIDSSTIHLRLKEGIYHFRFEATDNLGNTSKTLTEQAYFLAVDKSAPKVSLLTQQDNADIQPGEVIPIQWKATDDNFGSGPISLFSSNDGGLTWRAIILLHENSGSFSNWIPPSIPGVRYQVKLVAKDLCGWETEIVSKGYLQVLSTVDMAVATGPAVTEGLDVQVEYDLFSRDKKKIKALELWYRKHRDQDWNRYDTLHENLQTPIPWTAPETGRFHIYLRAINKDNSAMPAPETATMEQVRILVQDKDKTYFVFESGGDILAAGSVHVMQWQVGQESFEGGSLAIEFRASTSSPWRLLKSKLPARGQYRWKAPLSNTNKASLRLTAQKANKDRRVISLLTFAVDAKPPTFSIAADLMNRGRDISIRFTSSDNFSPAATDISLWYSSNRGMAWTRFPGFISSPYIFKPATDGLYSFYLSGKDNAGNHNPDPGKNTKALAQVLVDTTLPIVKLLQPLGNNLRHFPGHIPLRIQWESEDSQMAALPIRIYFSNNDGQDWLSITKKPIANTGSYLWRIPAALSIDDSDACKIKITAADSRGNIGESQSPSAFKIDSLAPTFSVVEESPVYAHTETTLNLKIDDGDGSGVAPILGRYRKRGSNTWKTYDIPYDGIEMNSVQFFAPEGAWELFFICTDKVGNHTPLPTAASQAHATVVLDQSKPKLIVQGLLENEVITDPKPQKISWTTTDANLSKEPVSVFIRHTSDTAERLLKEHLPAKGSYTLPSEQFQTNGDYTLTVRSQDKADNTGVASIAFSVDTVAPQVTLSVKPTAVDKQLALIAKSKHTDIKRIEYYVRSGQGEWNAVDTSDGLDSGIYLLPADGRYEFYAVAMDINGNRTTVPNQNSLAMAVFEQDNTGPQLNFAALQNHVFLGGSQLTLLLNASDQTKVNAKSLQFQVSTDNGKHWQDVKTLSLKQNTLAQPEATQFEAVLALPQYDVQALTIRAQLQDAKGNSSQAQLNAITVDATPPTIVFATTVARAVFAPGASCPLQWTASDLHSTGGHVTLKVSDGTTTNELAQNADWKGNFRYTVPNIKQDAIYTLTLDAFDALGNKASTSFDIRIDATAPPLTLLAKAHSNAGAIVLTANSSSRDLASVEYFARLVSQPWQSLGRKVQGQTLTYDLPGDGRYEFYAAATDQSGNVASKPEKTSQAMATYTLDMTNPDLAFLPLKQSVYKSAATIELQLNATDKLDLDTDTLTFSHSTDNGTTWNSLAPNSVNYSKKQNQSQWKIKITLPVSDIANYSIMASVKDQMGNLGKAVIHNLSVDATAPMIAFSTQAARPVFAPGTSCLLRWTATDLHTEGGSLTLKISDGINTDVLAETQDWNGTFTHTFQNVKQDTPYTFTLEARDVTGNTKTAIIQVSIDATAPLVTLSAQVHRGDAGTLSLATSSDSKDLSSVEYFGRLLSQDWRSLGHKAPGETLVYELPIEGRFEFFATATDLAGNKSAKPVKTSKAMATYMLDITNPNLAFLPLPKSVFQSASTLQLQLNATDKLDVDVESLTFSDSTDNGTTWNPLALETISYSKQQDQSQWKIQTILPAGDLANYSIKAQIKDQMGNTGQATIYNLSIDATAPVISFATTSTRPVFAPGKPCPLQWTAKDIHAEGGHLTLKLSNGATTSVLLQDGNWNADFSHTLPLLQQDTGLTYTLEVIDAAGNKTTQSVTISVDATTPVLALNAQTDAKTGIITLSTKSNSDDLASVEYFARLASKHWKSLGREQKNTSKIYNIPGDGQYEFYAIATDLAGNTATSPTADSIGMAFSEVDRTGPQLNFASLKRNVFRAGDTLTLQLNASDQTKVNAESLQFQVSTDAGKHWQDVKTVSQQQVAVQEGTQFKAVLTLPDHDVNAMVIQARLQDTTGNTSLAKLAGIVVDATAPTIEFTTTASRPVFAPGASCPLHWTARDLNMEGGHLTLKVSNGSKTDTLQQDLDWRGSFSHTFRQDKQDSDFTFTLEAIDAAGNKTIKTVAVAVDATAPALTLLAQATAQPGTVTLSADSQSSDIMSVEFFARLAEHDWQSLGHNVPGEPLLHNVLAEGHYEFYAVATDLVGNVSPTPVQSSKAMATYTMDVTNPDLAFLPLTVSVFKSASILKLQLHATDELNVDTKSLRFSDSTDSGVTWNPLTPKNVSFKKVKDQSQWTIRSLLPAIDVANYSIRAEIKDQSGNVGRAVMHNMYVDATAPTITIQSSTGHFFFALLSDCNLQWQVNDTHPLENAVEISLSIDNQTKSLGRAQARSGRWKRAMTKEDIGKVFVFTVKTKDAVGNTAASSITFGVDSQAPTTSVTIAEGPEDGKVLLRIKGEDEGVGLKRLHFYVRLQGQPWKKLSTFDTSDSLVYTFPVDGVYHFYCVGEDHANNRNEWPSQTSVPNLTYTYDHGTPDLSIDPPLPKYLAGGSIQNVVLLGADRLSLDKDTLTFSYAKATATGAMEWKPIHLLSSTAHTKEDSKRTEFHCRLELPFESIDGMIVRAAMADASGNIGYAKSAAVVLDHEVPQAVATQAKPLDDGAITLHYDARDEGFSGLASLEVWYRLIEGEWTRYDASFEALGQALTLHLPQGEYQFSVVAIDSAGNREPQPRGDNELFVEQQASVRPALPVILLQPKSWTRPLRGGENQTLTWECNGNHLQPDSVDIQFSRDNGETWEPLLSNQPLSGSHAWVVPALDRPTCQLRATVKDTFDQTGLADTSLFSIDSTGNNVELIFNPNASNTPDTPVDNDDNSQQTPDDNSSTDTGTDTDTENHVDTDTEETSTDQSNTSTDTSSSTEPNEYETPDSDEEHKPLTIDPEKMSLDELLYSGRLKLKLGKSAEAKQFFQMALKKDSRNAAAHGGLGRVFYRSRDLSKAITHFENAITYKVVDHEVYMDYGVLMYSSQKWMKARTLFYTASSNYSGKDNTEKSRILFNLGATEFVLRNFRNAISAFKSAYVNDDKNKRSLLYIAKCYTELFRSDLTNKSDWTNAMHYWKSTMEIFGHQSDQAVEARESIGWLEPLQPSN